MANPSESTVLQPREKQALQHEGTRPGLVFRPDVDIVEHPDAYVIRADLPGADESQVQVRLEKGVLSLDATAAEGPEPGWRPVHLEYRSGAYHREFRVSEEIDAEHVAAALRNGVLELRLPKAAKRRARTIAVQSG
jgi:HSP20 family protein